MDIETEKDLEIIGLKAEIEDLKERIERLSMAHLIHNDILRILTIKLGEFTGEL